MAERRTEKVDTYERRHVDSLLNNKFRDQDTNLHIPTNTDIWRQWRRKREEEGERKGGDCNERGKIVKEI